MAASLLSQPFECPGVTGNTGKTRGGGCTIFIDKTRIIKPGQRCHYKYAAAEGCDALELDGELWPDPLCGLAGTKLGVIVGDFHTKTFDAKLRCADLTRLLGARLAVKAPGLNFSVKNQKSPKFGWQLVAYGTGSGEDKRKAIAALRKGLDIEWEGWLRPAKLENSPTLAKKSNEENAGLASNRIYEENLAVDGRKIHVYKVNPAVIGDAEMIAKFTEECTKFGPLCGEPGFRTSRDNYAFSWIVYADAAHAENAMQDDALAAALSEVVADEEIGFVTAEFSYAADYKARKAQAPLVDVTADKDKERGLALRAAPEEVDKFIAAVLLEQATADALIKQIVVPTTEAVTKAMKAEGNRISTALAQQLEPLTRTMDRQAELIEALTEEMASLREPPKRRRNVSEDPRLHTRTARKVRHEATPAPASSRKPGKRDRSQGGQDALQMEDYEEVMSKLAATQAGEALITNFMGENFIKRHRSGRSKPQMGSEEDDSSEDSQ